MAQSDSYFNLNVVKGDHSYCLEQPDIDFIHQAGKYLSVILLKSLTFKLGTAQIFGLQSIIIYYV